MVELLRWLSTPGLGAAIILMIVAGIFFDQLALNISGKPVSRLLMLALVAIVLAYIVVWIALPSPDAGAPIILDQPSVWSVIGEDFESGLGFVALIAELWLVGFVTMLLLPGGTVAPGKK